MDCSDHSRNRLCEVRIRLSHWPVVAKLVDVAVSEQCYPVILALGGILIAYRLVREFYRHDMAYLYLEYLANYDFGFIRRGLVPELLSWALPRLDHLDIRIFAVVMVVVTLCAYVAMFAFRFGLSRQLPLLACTIASPCVFRNFAYDFARLDILGFLGAIIALALPINGGYSLALGALCCMLCLIHEAQFAVYVPVIVAVAAIRLTAKGDYFRGGFPWREAAALTAVALTMVLVVGFGKAGVPPEVLWAHLQARAVDPVINRITIWYMSPLDNMLAASTSPYLYEQLYRSPMYLLIVLAHVPLLRLIQPQNPARAPAVRIVLWLGLAAATAGFVLMFAISHDKARWFANWFSGLILIVHAARLTLPDGKVGLDQLRSPTAVAAAWLLVAISRVGLMAP